MSLYLFDTDTSTLFQFHHPQILVRIALHPTDTLAISVVTVEEQLVGWQQELARARDDTRRAEVYRRMALTTEGLSGWRVLPLTVTSLAHATALRRQRLNVGSYDLKIAATALENRATVVTRNLRDFRRIPGITCEDWAV